MKGQLPNHSFYKQDQTTTPTDFIYDEVYKSVSSKNKYSKNPKYTYYNTLLTMKQKLKQQQSPVFESVFNPPPRKASPSNEQSPNQRKALLPIYHVEKINKMKYKIYKQGAQYIEKLPVTDLSFQIRIKGEQEEPYGQNNRPRLEEILNQYRKMNLEAAQHKNRISEQKRNNPHGSDLSIKTMRKTVYKIGRSESHRR